MAIEKPIAKYFIALVQASFRPDGDHALLTVKDGIVVVKKGSTIADGFEL